ncbi:uncharacterized protein LOC118032011, partial [Aduncisulcus paluster]
MPFGLVNAPSHFQRVMNIALGEEIGKSCVSAKKDQLLWNDPKQGKCVIGVKRCEYLGFIVSSEGRSIAKSRVDDLTRLREPRSKKDVRCLLGLLNFIRDFIPQCSILCSRFQELLRNDVPFIWTEDHSAAFKDIIRMLKEAP